jgi:hypothetical protein
MLEIAVYLPKLQELHMGDNGIDKLEGGGKGLEGIVSLNLERNQIEDWDQIRTLSTLPR